MTSLLNEIEVVYCPNWALKNDTNHTSTFIKLLILAECSFEYPLYLKKALEDGESMLITFSFFFPYQFTHGFFWKFLYIYVSSDLIQLFKNGIYPCSLGFP